MAPRVRKRPEERREEILSAAAGIALTEGLERITLRAVADRLGVRPGLITHYFPAAEDLVVAAFSRAATAERDLLFPADGAPRARVVRIIAGYESRESWDLGRLWLNARHLARFSPTLHEALVEQEELNRAGLVSIIAEGVASGDFGGIDPQVACARILIAVDGQSSYVNTAAEAEDDTHAHFISDVADWALGLERGTMRRLVAGLAQD